MKNILIVIVGPTASGKTDLDFDIAKKYHGEVICADSRTIYKGLIIGTASPALDPKYKTIRHHLLHFVEPNYPFTVAEFQTLANQTIEDIQKRGKLPLLVGGTGLYVDAITK